MISFGIVNEISLNSFFLFLFISSIIFLPLGELACWSLGLFHFLQFCNDLAKVGGLTQWENLLTKLISNARLFFWSAVIGFGFLDKGFYEENMGFDVIKGNEKLRCSTNSFN